jgi:hypothetical protein
VEVKSNLLHASPHEHPPTPEISLYEYDDREIILQFRPAIDRRLGDCRAEGKSHSAIGLEWGSTSTGHVPTDTASFTRPEGQGTIYR